MKASALLLCALALLVAATAAGASDSDWLVYLRATSVYGTNLLNVYYTYGTRTGATDGYDTMDGPNPPGTGNLAGVASADLSHDYVPNGFWRDVRQPYTTATTWHLRLWVQSAYEYSTVVLSGWNPAGTYDLPESRPMELAVTDDPTGTYAANTVLYTWDGTANGSSTSPLFSVAFGNVSAIRGFKEDGVSLELRPAAGFGPAGMVPEPCALVALAFGLTALCKRRKA